MEFYCGRLPRSRGLDCWRNTSHTQKTDSNQPYPGECDQLAFVVSSYPCSVGQGIGIFRKPLHRIANYWRSLQSPGDSLCCEKLESVPALWAYPGTSSTPFHRSDLDSGQLFVETVVLTSLVTVAGLRVSASPAVSGLTVVGHRSTLELQQAPVRIQQTTTSSHKWDKVSLAQLIVPLVRLGSPRNRRVAIVPSELWGLCCTRLLSSQRWVGN